MSTAQRTRLKRLAQQMFNGGLTADEYFTLQLLWLQRYQELHHGNL